MATSSQSYDRRRRISAALRRLMPSGGHTWTVPVITLLLLLGLVAGAVIMSTVTRRHVQLDDGTVWVTSLKNQTLPAVSDPASAAFSASAVLRSFHVFPQSKEISLKLQRNAPAVHNREIVMISLPSSVVYIRNR